MSNRIAGERVFCYSCENEWDRAHGGLQCPRCESEFVEILENGTRPNFDDPPEVAPELNRDFDHNAPLHGLHNHNPWADDSNTDPDEGDINTVHFNSSGSPGSTNYSFTRTYTFGGRPAASTQRNFHSQLYQDAASRDLVNNFEGMLTSIMGPAARIGNGHFGGSININGRTTTFGSGTYNSTTSGPTPMPMGPPDFMSMMFPGPPGTRETGQPPGGMFGVLSHFFNPANARSGDHVWSQEAFDRVMSQLMEQNQQNGAPPAAEDRINSLPRKNVDKSMLGNDDKAECSICMDSVEIGTEVTVLPCQHWFHFECIKSWLSEHDTCPHCRKPITPDAQQSSSSRPSGARRSSRRSSSVASPLTQVRGSASQDHSREGGRQNPIPVPEDPSPSALRNAREQYYGRSESSRYREDQDREQRPSSERRSSRRSTGSGGGRDDGGGGTGVGSWLRNPFS